MMGFLFVVFALVFLAVVVDVGLTRIARVLDRIANAIEDMGK